MDTKSALDCLAALGQETRLETFRLLTREAPDGLHAGEIARRLGVVQNTMSAHLTVLVHAGLITADRQGRHIAYRADHEAIAALLRFLMEDCCQGTAELCGKLVQAISCSPGREGEENLAQEQDVTEVGAR